MSIRAWFMRPGGISCGRVRKLVQSYLDGELTGPDRDRLRDHLHLCPLCGVEAATYEHIKEALAAPAPPAAVARLESFAAALADEPDP